MEIAQTLHRSACWGWLHFKARMASQKRLLHRLTELGLPKFTGGSVFIRDKKIIEAIYETERNRKQMHDDYGLLI
jgi:hypothetical protein